MGKSLGPSGQLLPLCILLALPVGSGRHLRRAVFDIKYVNVLTM